MHRNGKKIVVIGSGIAGLCTAVYGLKCGYDVEVVEMNDQAGGLAMSWPRGEYTFETCLHWLVGSKPGGEFHDMWQEVFDIDKLTFVNQEIFTRLESEDGDALTIYTNADRLETELLRHAPQDAAAIRELTHAIRSLARFRVLEPSGGLGENWLNLLRDVPALPLMTRLSKMSGKEYGHRFSDPLLRRFFSDGDIGRMSAIAMVLSLAWMHAGNAGYCIGGSQAMIRLIEEKIRNLGGDIRFGARVERVVVANDEAVGVEVAGGKRIVADWVISAADGHATIFELLSGRYADEAIRKIYEEREMFASYVQVSLGVARDLRKEPPMISRILSKPLMVDPGTELDAVGFRFFHYDPTFAPAGRTAVTSLLPTRNDAFWGALRKSNPVRYHEEKQRVANAVTEILERRIPGISTAIEATDVSTPATVMRHTGNWKGSMEGWLVQPGIGVKPLPNTLPGLKRFVMVGQWISPGGGLPSGPMTARPALRWICRQDHVPFTVKAHELPEFEPVGM